MTNSCETIHTTTLSNGLRVVLLPTSNAVGCCGVLIDAGARDDFHDAHGLAHFVEHTIFKGTTHRKAWHILNRMEAVGGELNAYTTKDNTAIYTVFPDEHLDRALELVADLTCNSTFPAAELEREREVVNEEIESYLDTPSEAIYDDFEDIIFSGSDLGHNILGNSKSLARIDSDTCLRYTRTFFTAGNMVLFVASGADRSKVWTRVNRYFSTLPTGKPCSARTTPPATEQFHITRSIDSHQAHVMIGARIFGALDQRHFDISLLNNILGGPGMNSLLNVQLRERRGMVYSVGSSVALFSDCGLMQIYFGCDEQHITPCMRLTEKIIAQLADTPLSPRQLAAAKKQFIGQLLVASVNTVDSAIAAAKSMLLRNKVSTNEEIIDRINAITAPDIQSAAALLATHTSSLIMK